MTYRIPTNRLLGNAGAGRRWLGASRWQNRIYSRGVRGLGTCGL